MSDVTRSLELEKGRVEEAEEKLVVEKRRVRVFQRTLQNEMCEYVVRSKRIKIRDEMMKKWWMRYDII